MESFLVLGLGRMGVTIFDDLLTHTNDKILGFEADSKRLKAVKNKFEKYESRIELFQGRIDLTAENEIIEKLFKRADIAISAIDYRFNEYFTNLAIKHSTHLVDLGGNPEVVAKQRELNNKAKESKITIIPDCGLAPGMVNIIAAAEMEEFDTLDECHIRVGGLPQDPKTILNYQQVFSIRGLTNEYIEDAIVIRDGKKQDVPSLTEIEELHFDPFEDLEAFQTAGGTGSLPLLFEGEIDELTYKTIRYKGHAQYFQFLQQLGMFDEKEKYGTSTRRQIVEAQLEELLPQEEKDVVLIKITICGEKDGKYTLKTLKCIDYFDDDTGYTAMARTTAFPVSIIAQMIGDGRITDHGVVYAEKNVENALLLQELEDRKIKFNTTISFD